MYAWIDTGAYLLGGSAVMRSHVWHVARIVSHVCMRVHKRLIEAMYAMHTLTYAGRIGKEFPIRMEGLGI